MPQVISVTIVNSGKKPIVVKGYGLLLKDKTIALFPNVMNLFNEKKLEPYKILDITLPHNILLNLIEKSEEIKASFYDTVGKKWFPKRKVQKDFIKSLINKKSEKSR
ncbi:MAG: hypothetical protein K1060chlam1_01368 [Candidatus Anoxychlamydiales bacterium]|nr:hypothetical protein [Candidatus Anoxychlamydiales bacterium]